MKKITITLALFATVSLVGISCGKEVPQNNTVKQEPKSVAAVAEPSAPKDVAQAPQVTDTDGDGLTDEQERKLGTDINKSDTDGDGYSDFTEVQSGYNPLGAGKLNPTADANQINCGRGDSLNLTQPNSNSSASLKAWECFADSLATCKPMKMLASVQLRTYKKGEDVTYAVIGKQDVYCLVSGPKLDMLNAKFSYVTCKVSDKAMAKALDDGDKYVTDEKLKKAAQSYMFQGVINGSNSTVAGEKISCSEDVPKF